MTAILCLLAYALLCLFGGWLAHVTDVEPTDRDARNARKWARTKATSTPQSWGSR